MIQSMPNLNFEEDDLGLVSPLHFVYTCFMFLMLHSINWPNFVVWLPLLLEILGNMCIFRAVKFKGKIMCDNELFPKDSLSLMSPEGPPWLHLSWGATKIFKIDTSRLLENDLPRTFSIYPLTVRNNWKLGYI